MATRKSEETQEQAAVSIDEFLSSAEGSDTLKGMFKHFVGPDLKAATAENLEKAYKTFREMPAEKLHRK